MEATEEEETITIVTEVNRVEWERLEGITKHIRLVQESCFELAKGLFDAGEPDFARKLIARSMLHDQSKFFGIEWTHLHRDVEDTEARKLAHFQHVSVNDHHPEFYENGDHGQMSRLAVAEMVCDWKARSEEFGTGLREWINEKAMARYNIPKTGKIAKWIKTFLDLLLEKPFTGL